MCPTILSCTPTIGARLSYEGVEGEQLCSAAVDPLGTCPGIVCVPGENERG